jgi:hypothetical protein
LLRFAAHPDPQRTLGKPDSCIGSFTLASGSLGWPTNACRLDVCQTAAVPARKNGVLTIL